MERAFGRFRLLERVGRGGMGEVFRARMEGPGGFVREVAVKVILPHLSGEPGFRELFNREARLAALLHHPGIVSVLDYGREGEEDYLVMEFVRGTDLRTLLLSSPLSHDPSALVLLRVARALAHAHGTSTPESPGGILHRDVSPHNILLSREGEVKLADFGIARAAGSGTGATALRGKAAFMAPEVVEGGELTPRSDLFSLGAVAYLLFAGRAPFDRDNEAATLRAVAEARHRPLAELAPGCPPALAALVESLLEKDPARRPQGAAEVADRLEPFLDPGAERELAGRVAQTAPAAPGAGAPSRSAAGPTAPTLLPAPSRWRWGAPLAGAAALAAAAVFLFLPAAPLPVPEPVPAPAPAPAPVPAPAPAPVPAPPPEPAFAPRGEMPISATPWAIVWFEGKKLGQTPLTGVSLPVGRQTLTLENPALGTRREVTVEVREGRNPPLRVEMAE